MTSRVSQVLGVVNPLGWVVLALGALTGAVAALAHWRELMVIAAACGLLLLVALPFLVGRTRVRVDLTLEPERVVAGESVAAGVDVVNLAGRRLLPTAAGAAGRGGPAPLRDPDAGAPAPRTRRPSRSAPSAAG